ncbi:MAG: hypothetical protein Q4B31_02170 [Clostridia bacterium]|nr:hypothetical protein [Clostridia bacterium]
MLTFVALFGCEKSDTSNDKAETKSNEILSKEEAKPEPDADSDKEKAELKFDGYYCFIRDEDNDGYVDNRVLRFFEDGTVIGVSIEQTEENNGYFPKGDWFDKDYEDNGTYSIDGDEISFSITSSNGTVDYRGTVEEDELTLDSYSHINGFSSSGREYEFYSFEDVPK